MNCEYKFRVIELDLNARESRQYAVCCYCRSWRIFSGNEQQGHGDEDKL